MRWEQLTQGVRISVKEGGESRYWHGGQPATHVGRRGGEVVIMTKGEGVFVGGSARHYG